MCLYELKNKMDNFRFNELHFPILVFDHGYSNLQKYCEHFLCCIDSNSYHVVLVWQ